MLHFFIRSEIVHIYYEFIYLRFRYWLCGEVNKISELGMKCVNQQKLFNHVERIQNHWWDVYFLANKSDVKGTIFG